MVLLAVSKNPAWRQMVCSFMSVDLGYKCQDSLNWWRGLGTVPHHIRIFVVSTSTQENNTPSLAHTAIVALQAQAEPTFPRNTSR